MCQCICDFSQPEWCVRYPYLVLTSVHKCLLVCGAKRDNQQEYLKNDVCACSQLIVDNTLLSELHYIFGH